MNLAERSRGRNLCILGNGFGRDELEIEIWRCWACVVQWNAMTFQCDKQLHNNGDFIFENLKKRG